MPRFYRQGSLRMMEMITKMLMVPQLGIMMQIGANLNAILLWLSLCWWFFVPGVVLFVLCVLWKNCSEGVQDQVRVKFSIPALTTSIYFPRLDIDFSAVQLANLCRTAVLFVCKSTKQTLLMKMREELFLKCLFVRITKRVG